MNKLYIIGNCTRDPELRSTPSGKSVCSFTVAVNRRKKTEEQPETEYFRVTAWDALADNCGKYLQKGKKVAVIGSVSLKTYTNSKGEQGASLEVNANEVEFLSPRGVDPQTGMEKVNVELPY